MPRYFKPISMEEFERRFDGGADEDGSFDSSGENDLSDYRVLKRKVLADLKVQFDLENVGSYGPKEITGVHVTRSGLVFKGIMAGGDWELPVFWMVYWDGRALRAYVPTDGNLYNTDTMQAYGNDPEADGRNIRKRFPELCNKDLGDEDIWYRCENQLSTDARKIIADIESRIIPQPGGDAKPKATKGFVK